MTAPGAPRPLNFGLTDAISRIGGWSRPELPSLLDGIQGVLVYGDVSKSVASEVFEARAMAGQSTGENVFLGFELSSRTPGGIVVEAIDAALQNDAGLPTLGLNIVESAVGVNPVPFKLDVGGLVTQGELTRLVNPVAFGALLVWEPSAFTGAGIFYAIQNRTRIWVPPGSFFQVFPVGTGHVFFTSLHITWRELADTQGTP